MAGGRAGIHSVFCGWFYLFNITCDPVFVPVWSMAGEGSGIHSFTFLISLILTNITVVRLMFIDYSVQKSPFLNEILLSASLHHD